MKNFRKTHHAIFVRWRQWGMERKNAVTIMRRSGFRPGAGSGELPPTPILSLEGVKKGVCSTELQELIGAFRAGGEAAQADLIAYIEGELGQTIAEAYPEEWEAALNGENPTITIDLGTDTLTLTLGQCGTAGPDPDNACQVELAELVDAVNTSPTIGEIADLFAFIQNHTGQTMEELLGADWAEIIETGESFTATIYIPDCDASVELWVGAEQNLEMTCEDHLAPYPPISFGQNDFDLSEIITATSDFSSTAAVQNYTERYFPQGHSDIELHLDDPEFVYLTKYDENDISPGEEHPDQTLIYRLDRVSYAFAGGVGAGSYSNSPSPQRNFYPYYRIKGRWTCKIELMHGETYNSGSLVQQTYTYGIKVPLVGFTHLLRYTHDSPLAFVGLTSDPLKLGVAVGTGVDVAHEGAPTSEDQDVVEIANNISAFPPATSQRGSTTAPYIFTHASWWLPMIAVGDPSPMTNQGSANGFMGWDSNSPLQSIRQTTGTQQFSQAAAWTDFVTRVETYQDFAGVYDPQLILDEDGMEMTVIFEDDKNACYLPLIGCLTNLIAGEDFDPPYDNPVHQSYSITWGSHLHDVGYDDRGWPTGASGYYSRTNQYGGGQGRWPKDTWMNQVARRIVVDEVGDNVGYAAPNQYVEKLLPKVIGEFTPLIDAAEDEFPSVCPKDARCITAGSP
jgi:hypothetical protein